jgi:hypothetical protein
MWSRMRGEPSLGNVSFHIACHGSKVSVAGIPHGAREVANVFGVLGELGR